MSSFAITNTNHKNLDGLRAIGILMVMAKHFYGSFIDLDVMWVSIDLLFALSGMLISGILIETKDDPKYFQKFYMRRILRIFPLYYLLVVFFFIFANYIISHPEELQYYTGKWIYFFTYTQNWCFIMNGLPDTPYLDHTWSLAVDEQIYIAWPLLIWICKNPKQLILLCGGALLFSLIFRVAYIYSLGPDNIHPFPYFHNTFCRLDSFAAGSLLYCILKFNNEWVNRKRMTLLFIITLLIFITFGILDNNFDFTGYWMSNFGFTLIGLHFTTWLYFAVKRSYRFINKIFSNTILVYIGKISYSLYVFHWFLFVLLAPRVSKLLSHYLHSSSFFFAASFCLILTFAISMLSYQYFEKPIINLKRKFSYKI